MILIKQMTAIHGKPDYQISYLPEADRTTFLSKLLQQASTTGADFTVHWNESFELYRVVPKAEVPQEWYQSETSMRLPCVTVQWDDDENPEGYQLLWVDLIELDDSQNEELLYQLLREEMYQHAAAA